MAGREEVGIDLTARDLASDEIRRVGGHIDNLDGGLTTAGASAGRFGGAFRAMATGVLMGVGQQAFAMATNAIRGFVGGAVDAASNLAEAQSKVDVVFGDSADEIHDWAARAEQDLGLSAAAAEGAAGTYAAMFKAMGMGLPRAKDMSLAVVQLSQDLGSFNNIEPDIMLDKLRAALTGEFEPMKQLGVVLNEATLKTKALEMGVWDGVGVLDAATKAQVVYAEVVRQTADAQGDFARTADGYANQQRINAAEMENASARLGASLLPLAAVVMPAVTQAFKVLAGGIELVLANAAPVGAALAVIGGVVLSAVVPPFIAWAAATIAATWPLIALGAAVALFVLAVQNNFLWLGDIVGGVFGFIRGIVQTLVGFLLEVASVAIGIAASIPGPWQEGAQAVKDSIDSMKADVASWGEEASDGATGAADDVARALRAGGPEVADAAGEMIAGLPEAVDGANADVKEIASRTPGDIASSMLDSLDELDEMMEDLADEIVNSVSDAKERAEIEAALASQVIRDGLNSQSTKTRLDTLDLVEDLISKYETLAPGALAAGRLVGPAYVDGVSENMQLVRDTATAMGRQLGPLDMAASARVWGTNIAVQFASGIETSRILAAQAAARMAAGVAGFLEGFSPPKEGPLARIDVGARNVALAWVRSFGSVGEEARRSALLLAAPVAGVLDGVGSGPAPDVAGLAASGGRNVSIVNYFGRDSVRSDEDIHEIDRRLALQVRLAGGVG